jgi:hypothetical protein
MTQDEVLELFRKQATMLGEVRPTQADIILRLARLLAASKEQVSTENFDELVEIGAVMYQESVGKLRARSEVTETMRQSVRDWKTTS